MFVLYCWWGKSGAFELPLLFIVIKVMNWTIFKYLSRINGYDLHSENLIFINISYLYLTSVLQISRLACMPFLFCLFMVILIWGFKCVFFFLHHLYFHIYNNLKSKCHNKSVNYDLYCFLYAYVKSYDISILFN